MEDLLQAGKTMNPNISRFDASCFDGDYITGDIDEEYLEDLLADRGLGKVGAVKSL